MDAKFNVRLLPNNVQLEVGEWATFNCTVSCAIYNTHTIKWFVGDFDSAKRLVNDNFTNQTGIPVQTKKFTTTCQQSSSRKGTMLYQLRIKASSVALVNKTPVQCAALTKSPFYSDHYSYYGIVLVKGIVFTNLMWPHSCYNKIISLITVCSRVQHPIDEVLWNVSRTGACGWLSTTVNLSPMGRTGSC